MSLNEGLRSFELNGIHLDVKGQAGDLALKIAAQDTLRGGVIDSAQITITPADELIDPRVSGRTMALSLMSEAVDGTVRLGKPTAFIKDGGTRR